MKIEGFIVDGLVVKRSGIHGKGLFTKQRLREGQQLGRCSATPTTKDTPYTLWLEDENAAVRVTCDFKYINHSSDPNVAYYDDLTVHALRDIAPGEELTHHYGDDWD